MFLAFDCPKCLKTVRQELPQSSRSVTCPECGWNRPFDEREFQNESIASCIVCGCDDLWRQKDFDPRIGVTIAVIGVLISTVQVAYMLPGWGLITLMVIGLADGVLYAILPDRLVCYRCHAQYRHIPKLENVSAFDLEVNERYRQEGIRLRNAQNSARR